MEQLQVIGLPGFFQRSDGLRIEFLIVGRRDTVLQFLFRKICQETEGRVSVANYNCPGQVVITGEDTAVERAGMALKEAGARRVLPLKVSGPFHSPMLEGAGKKLAEVLKTVTVQAPMIPYVTNVTAEYVTEEEGIKEGIEKGEKNKAMEIAKSLINLGLDKEAISKSTGLDLGEIEKLMN